MADRLHLQLSAVDGAIVEDQGLAIDAVLVIVAELADPSCIFAKSMPGKYVKAGDLDVCHVNHPSVAFEIYLKVGVTRIPA